MSRVARYPELPAPCSTVPPERCALVLQPAVLGPDPPTSRQKLSLESITLAQLGVARNGPSQDECSREGVRGQPIDLTKQGGYKASQHPDGRIDAANTKGSPGNDLLSHTATSAVPSALEGLTTRFGMELGVSPPLASPEEPISSHCGFTTPAPHRLAP